MQLWRKKGIPGSGDAEVEHGGGDRRAIMLSLQLYPGLPPTLLPARHILFAPHSLQLHPILLSALLKFGGKLLSGIVMTYIPIQVQTWICFFPELQLRKKKIINSVFIKQQTSRKL